MSRRQDARRMLASSVCSEAARNLASGTSRALLLVLGVLVLIGGAAGMDVRTIVGLSASAADFRQSGAAIQVFTAPAGVSGQRCDALRSVPGVVAAGAARPAAAPAVFLSAPDAGIGTVEATPGLLGVLESSARPRVGGWLSQSAAATLGAVPGTTLPTSLGAVEVTAEFPYPDDASDRSLAYALLTPVPPTGVFDSCWVLVWPHSEAVVALVRGTFVGDPAEQSAATVAQLNTRLGAVFDGPRMFTGRATAQAPVVTALLGLALGAGSVRTRRLELAGALHAQVPKDALVAQIGLELLAVALASALPLTAVTHVLAAHGNPDPLWPAWSAGLRAVATGSLATVLGGVLMAATTSEKRLFQYFKER